MTRNDIKVAVKLYLGRHQATFLQQYQSLALVVSQALGGSTGTQKKLDVQPPKTKAEAELAFKSVFGA